MASSKSRKRRKRRTRAAAAGRDQAAGAEEAPKRATPAPRRTAADEPPPAPWGSFPLVELCVLAAIVMLILGFFVIGGSRGAILIAAGLALGSIGGLELSIREHFAGYRSHTTLLAGFVFVVVVGLLFYAFEQVLAVALPIGAACFLLAFLLARRAFQRASGGLSYRVGGLRG